MRYSVIEKKYILGEGSVEFTPLSSFPFGDKIRFCVFVPLKDRVSTTVLRIHDDTTGKMSIFPMTAGENEGDKACFFADVDTEGLCAGQEDGLFWYCYDVYYPDHCVTYDGEDQAQLKPCGEMGKRQLLIYRRDFTTPDWLRGGIIYHIFVDRFCTSGRCGVKPGAVKNPDWDNGIPQFAPYPGADLPNNEFFGGDLYGIIEKLDYIASLGANCLYLSPIFDSPSNHKYDTGDYEHVDSMFGGDEALDALIAAAKERGIRILLDGVFNHTGADSKYFNQKGNYDSLGAAQSVDSPYYPWYSFRAHPSVYESWWGIGILPKVRCDNESYREYILGEKGIIARYMERGIAGWRLDVADELSDGFLDALRSRVRACDPQAMIYGEVWEDASNKIAYSYRRRYLRGMQLDSVMNYPLRDAVVSYIRDGNAEALAYCINTVYRHYPKAAADTLMNFLGTHDTLRVLTALGGIHPYGHSNEELSRMRMSDDERTRAIALLKMAYQLICIMPGVPCIFYGDEAGMEGYGDPFCRRTFPWGREDLDLTEFYRHIGTVHRLTPVLRDGYVRLVRCTQNHVMILRYNGKDHSMLMILNRSETPLSVHLSEMAVGADHTFSGDMPVIPPRSARYYLLSDCCDNVGVTVLGN